MNNHSETRPSLPKLSGLALGLAVSAGSGCYWSPELGKESGPDAHGNDWMADSGGAEGLGSDDADETSDLADLGAGDLGDAGTGDGETGDGNSGSGDELDIDDDDDVDGDDTAGGDEGGADSGTCEPVDRTFAPPTPSVVLVVDKSSSMMQPWEHDGTPSSRWLSMHAAVAALTSTFQDTVDFGLQLFPLAGAGGSVATGACDVSALEVPVGPQNASAVLSMLPGADATVAGESPTTAAVAQAVDHLRDFAEGQPKTMILLTDGAATCSEVSPTSYDPQLNEVIGNAHAAYGIATHVVGLDIVDEVDSAPGGSGVNVWEELNDAAEQGGAPKPDLDDPERFHNVHDGTNLSETLQAIASQLDRCVFDLDGDLPPVDFSVSIDGNAVEQISDCDEEDGWKWAESSATFGTVKLCGQACDSFLSAGGATVTYGCL